MPSQAVRAETEEKLVDIVRALVMEQREEIVANRVTGGDEVAVGEKPGGQQGKQSKAEPVSRSAPVRIVSRSFLGVMRALTAIHCVDQKQPETNGAREPRSLGCEAAKEALEKLTAEAKSPCGFSKGSKINRLNVCTGSAPPADAFVQIEHDETHYWIGGDDEVSKRTFGLLGNVFALQASVEASSGPVLTIGVD